MHSFGQFYLASMLLMGTSRALKNCGMFDDMLPEAMERIYEAMKDGVKLGPYVAIAHTAVAERSEFQCDPVTNEIRYMQIKLKNLVVGIGENKMKEAAFNVLLTFTVEEWGSKKTLKVEFLNWGDPMCGSKKCGKGDADVREFGKALPKEKAESNLQIQLLTIDWSAIAVPNKYIDKPTEMQVELANKVAAVFEQRTAYGQDPEIVVGGFKKSELMIRYTGGKNPAVLVRTPDDTSRITLECYDNMTTVPDLHTEYQFFVIVHAKDKSVKVGIRNAGTLQNIQSESLTKSKCKLDKMDERVTGIMKTVIQRQLI